MQYQTMILELIQECPAMHRHLCESRTLLPTMERLAIELKTSHEAWKQLLREINPEIGESQMASEAMELALQSIRDSLPTESDPSDDTFNLDQAMAFLHSPRA